MDAEEILGALLGDDMLGAPKLNVQAIAQAMKNIQRKGPLMRLQAKPAWRKLAVAPGVNAPAEGREMLPLVPSANNGIFTSAVNAIEFSARPQAPFQGQRLLVRVARTGAAGIIIFGQGIFIGRMLQQVQRGNFDVEFYGPTAFGVEFDLDPCTPGMDVAIPCIPSSAVPVGESLAVSMQLLGKTLR